LRNSAALAVDAAAPPTASFESTSGIEPVGRKDSVTSAVYAAPSSIELRFADGFQRTCTFKTLDLDMSELNPATIRAAIDGASVEVEDWHGDLVDLDASSLRYSADPDYAKEIDAAIAVLHTPQNELQEMLPHCRPPEIWYREDHSGLLASAKDGSRPI